jgi:CPA2 family monovalent cation:H+ antiporter-2
MVEANLVLTAGVFLTALALGGCSRSGWGSVIPAYILVGVLLGPYAPSIGGVSLTVVGSTEIVRLLADLGVVLLLFFVGLELSLASLIRKRSQFLRAGAVDVAVSSPLGIVVGLAAGFSLVESLFVGVIVVEDVLTAAAFAVLSAVLLGGADVASLGRFRPTPGRSVS